MLANTHILWFLVSYVAAWLLDVSRLAGRNVVARYAMIGLGIAGVFAQLFYLFNRFRDTQLPPLLSSAHDWVLVLAWVLAVMILILAILQSELPIVTFALPVVLALIASTYFLSAPDSLLTEPDRVQALKSAQRIGTMAHASSLVLGMGSVAVGLVSAVMYLVKHHQLKARHADQQGWRMPSLERLAAWNRWSVMAAFAALTVGMLTGVFLGFRPSSAEHGVRFSDPLVISSAGLWLALTVLILWQLTHRQQSGRQVAWQTACACGFLLLTLVGLPLLLGGSGFHAS